MKTLKQKDVLDLMREEWTRGVKNLSEKVDMVFNSKVDGSDKEPVIAPELKVRHKKSQIRYTVSSVGPQDIILRTPEGETFLIDQHEFEKNYQLDLMTIHSKHTLAYCNLCETEIVLCATCNNNCCNGVFGKVKGVQCIDCPEAYDHQEAYWKDNASVRFAHDKRKATR